MSKKKSKSGKTYQMLAKTYPKIFEGVEALGKAVRKAGPLDEKTSQLVQLAAAAASGSEGRGPFPCAPCRQGRGQW
jgi:4-carboxymuconolactone decarboxylase